MATLKAGTYKFNDLLTAPESYIASSISFVCGTANYLGIVVLTSDTLTTVTYADGTDNGVKVYNNGWLSTEYQTITVLADTEVEDWYEANIEYVGGSNITPTTEVIYKNGAVIIDAGKTITLHTAGHKFTEDLVIKTNKGQSSGGGSGAPIEVATEAEMTALLETAEVGSVYKYVGETTDTYENGGLYIVEAVE